MDAATRSMLRDALKALDELVVPTPRGGAIWCGGGIRALESPLGDLSFAAMYPSMGKIPAAARAVAVVIAAALEATPATSSNRTAIEHAKGLLDKVLVAFPLPALAA